MVINGERIVHTAHQASTVRKQFRYMLNAFEDNRFPEVKRMVKSIYRGTGEETIELTNGGMIEFKSRSRSAMRGFDGISVLILDEAQELVDDEMESLMAVLSASATGQRQIFYAGTPPYPSCPGTVFLRYRNACLDAKEKNEVDHNSWIEWSIPSDPLEKIDISNRDLWYMTNPSLGKRLSLEFTEQEFRTLDADGFARERLCWIAPMIEEKQEYLIKQEVWDSCRSDEVKPEGKTAYGIKFSADGSEVCLCGCVISKDGKARISIIDRKPMGEGLAWLANWLNERYKVASCVVIDGRNGSDVLIDKIRPVWVFRDSIIKPSAQDVITSTSMLLNELNEHNLTWYSGQEALRESALSSVKRSIGQGFGFGGADSAPIEACALALYGCKTSKRNPQRVMRIG